MKPFTSLKFMSFPDSRVLASISGSFLGSGLFGFGFGMKRSSISPARSRGKLPRSWGEVPRGRSQRQVPKMIYISERFTAMG
jgi:hypothetical protein